MTKRKKMTEKEKKHREVVKKILSELEGSIKFKGNGSDLIKEVRSM